MRDGHLLFFRSSPAEVAEIVITCEGLRVWSVEYPLMLLRDDQKRLLREAGFRGVEFFGSYRGEQYDKNTSGRLIAVARK